MSEINTNEIELLAIEFRNRQAIKETPRAKIFRHKLKEIENILNTDYSIKKFVDELNRYGYEITLGAFKNDLYRARQHLKSKNNNSSIEKLPSNNNQSTPHKTDLIPSTNNQNEENRKKPENQITVKQLRLQAEAEIKELNKNAKPIHSKAVQKIIDKQEEKERLKNEQEPEIKKHLSNKEKAELRIAELGIDFNANPLLERRLQQLKDKEDKK